MANFLKGLLSGAAKQANANIAAEKEADEKRRAEIMKRIEALQDYTTKQVIKSKFETPGMSAELSKFLAENPNATVEEMAAVPGVKTSDINNILQARNAQYTMGQNKRQAEIDAAALSGGTVSDAPVGNVTVSDLPPPDASGIPGAVTGTQMFGPPMPAAPAPTPAAPTVAANPRDAERQQLEQREASLKQQLINARSSNASKDVEAKIQANLDMVNQEMIQKGFRPSPEAQLDMNKKDTALIDELRKAADNAGPAIAIADQALAAIPAIGPTGVGGSAIGVLDKLLSAGPLDNVIPGDVASREFFNTLNVKEMLTYVQQTKGAISEAENRLFASAAVGEDKTPEGNTLIALATKYAQMRTQEKATFYEEWRRRYPSLDGAQRAFQQYAEDNPLFIVPEKAVFNNRETQMTLLNSINRAAMVPGGSLEYLDYKDNPDKFSGKNRRSDDELRVW